MNIEDGKTGGRGELTYLPDVPRTQRAWIAAGFLLATVARHSPGGPEVQPASGLPA